MFESRRQAGEKLGAALQRFATLNPAVYGLVRGGLPVAAAVAEHLGAPLDIVLVRKIGAPMQPELAIGAIADGAAPAVVLHKGRIRELGVDDEYLRKAVSDAETELRRRRTAFFNAHKPLSPASRTVILVDDGLATGATMEAAVKAMRNSGARRIIVAAPVAPTDAVEKFQRIADDVVCLETPTPFWAVGNHYGSFPQLTDSDVVAILAESDSRHGGKAAEECA